MSDLDIFELLNLQAYTLNPDTGEINSNPRGRVKQSYDEDGYAFVRIHSGKKRKNISVSKLVWMWMTRCLVPNGFQIHHRDEDRTNNSWPNLICLHQLDHRKFHTKEEMEEIPF